MTLNLSAESDFGTILTDLGRSISRIPRTAGATDGLGETTWTEGAPVAVTALVEDVSAQELRKYPGILEVGDKRVWTATADRVPPTDFLTIDSFTYRTVEETRVQYGGSVRFNEYLVRRQR